VQAEAEAGSVLRAFRDRAQPPSGDGAFRSLRGGMGDLVKALLDRLPDGSMWTASPVTNVTRSAAQWTVATPANTFTAAAVIVAAPAHAAARCLTTLSPRLASLCAEVPYVSTASVALAWPRAQVPHPLSGTGFVVARQHSALRIVACSWVTSKWAGRAPDEMVLLRAFIGGATDPDAVALPDAALIELATADLAAVLGMTTAPVLARVHRWVAAGAQHNVGHAERMERIDRLVADEPGLFVAGSGFRSIGVPDCIAEGRRAAGAAADYVKIHQ
jgi:protoporphyrinogen/coproporphyrinogen III oxidase